MTFSGKPKNDDRLSESEYNIYQDATIIEI